MTTVGGKFTSPKRNLVTYIEHEQYQLLKLLAARHGRSVSAEAAMAIRNYLQQHGGGLAQQEPEPLSPGHKAGEGDGRQT